MTFEEMRVYMTRPEGNCWVGVSMADGNMAMIHDLERSRNLSATMTEYLSVTRWKLRILTRL